MSSSRTLTCGEGIGVGTVLEHLFAKLEQRDRLTAEERDVLEDAVSEVRLHEARTVIVPGGRPLFSSNVLLDGYVARYKDLPGGQRQILEIHIPGDFIDLPSFLLKVLEHDIVALTDARVAIVPHDRLMRITETRPHLTRMLWFNSMLESAMYREQILSVGRRSAIARLAHLFCELYVRHQVQDAGETDGFPFPLTQAHVADATGMTPVHVNRMLRQLREQALVEIANRRLRILDWERLRGLADFDPAYLYLEKRPR